MQETTCETNKDRGRELLSSMIYPLINISFMCQQVSRHMPLKGSQMKLNGTHAQKDVVLGRLAGQVCSGKMRGVELTNRGENVYLWNCD